MNKNKILIALLNEAMQLAAEGWELADAYAVGESENADALAKRIEELEYKIDNATTNEKALDSARKLGEKAGSNRDFLSSATNN